MNYAELEGHIRADAVLRHIKKWKSCLRTEKSRRNVERLEASSEMEMDMGQISAVVDDHESWRKCDKVLRKAARGSELTVKERKLVTAFLACVVKLKAYQR